MARVLRVQTSSGVVYFKSWAKQIPAVTGKKMAAEVAGYKLSKHLGLGLVPRTWIAMRGLERGSCQDEVPASYTQASAIDGALEELKKESWQPAVSELLTFDYLAAITDRHTSNFFMDVKAKRFEAIDNDSGFTFPLPLYVGSEEYLSRGKLPASYPPQLCQAVRDFKYETLRKKMKKLLPPELIEAVWMRVQVVLADMQAKEP